MFIHLHTHSHYSLLDGLAKIDDLIAKAQKFNMPALALTDHGNMYGAVEFYQKCQQAGIKPILGCEVYIAPRSNTDKDPKLDTQPFHLTLLVKNEAGYQNLLKIVSNSYLKGFYYKPRTDKTLLKKYSDGLIALSGCLAGEIARLILSGKSSEAQKAAVSYQALYGPANFYLEIQPHDIPSQAKVNEELKKISQAMNIPLSATNDIHYVDKDDRQAHEVLLAVNTGKSFEDEKRLSLKECDLSMNTPSEMEKIFKDSPQALKETMAIAKKINFQMKFGELILPRFNLPAGQSAFEFLAKKTRQGFVQKYPQPTAEQNERLSYELSIIKKTGFGSYFLIVAEFVNWAKSQGIAVGPGRGSAAGSIVSYCLDITTIEPLRYGLLFERFLNPERIAPPDIDLDFADDRRDEVIKHITQTYGADHVAQIITFGVMKARLSIRDVTRSLGYPYELGDRIAKQIPFGLTLEQSLEANPDLKKIYRSEDDVAQVIDMSKKLEGVVRHASTHAAGLVISQKPLVEYVPLQHSTHNDDAITTQYPMFDLEAIGLLKIDILGLANLTIMKNACRIIKKIHHKIIDIDSLPLDDKKTFEMLARGETVGVFQLESEGMRHYIKELQPTRLEDIIAMVALYRPGPIEYIPQYIQGKRGLRQPRYLHPKLQPILDETYGIAVYQEQVLQITRDIAGFSYGEADILRKAVGKKIKKLLQQQRKKFIEKAIQNQVDKKIASQIFDFIEPFARYGFNKSHATCYAMIAYQTAYLKAHYPAPFMAALLTSEQKNLDKVAVAIGECDRLGIRVMPPDINESFVEFGVIPEKSGVPVIRYGLEAIKNVGTKVAQNLVEERQKNGAYQNLVDLLSRHTSQTLNKKVIEALAKAGALDRLAERNQILAGINEILKYIQNQKKEGAALDLFGSQNIVVERKKLVLPEIDPASGKQLLAWEKEFLGMYISSHPLHSFRPILENHQTKLANLNVKMAGKRVKVAGIITSCKKIVTKNNQPMMFCRLEDLNSSTEVIVFPKTLEKNSLAWRPDNIVAIAGKVNTKDGTIKIIADEVQEASDQQTLAQFLNSANDSDLSETEQIELFIEKGTSQKTLAKIKQALEAAPGSQPVILRIAQNGGFRTMTARTKISPSPELITHLKEILGENQVRAK